MSSASLKLSHAINRFFGIGREASSYYCGEDFFYKSTIGKYLNFNNVENTEVPMFCISEITHRLRLPNTEILIPLTNDTSKAKTYKTPQMLFYNLIAAPKQGCRLATLKDSNGNIYHGSYGILMDSNKNPLMLATVKTKNGFIQVSEVLLYIHPSIFTENKILHKYIKEKVIPCVLEGVRVSLPSSYSIYPNLEGPVVPKIIVSNEINKFFTTTKYQDSDDISDIILDNIDDFYDFISR